MFKNFIMYRFFFCESGELLPLLLLPPPRIRHWYKGLPRVSDCVIFFNSNTDCYLSAWLSKMWLQKPDLNRNHIGVCFWLSLFFFFFKENELLLLVSYKLSRLHFSVTVIRIQFKNRENTGVRLVIKKQRFWVWFLILWKSNIGFN